MAETAQIESDNEPSLVSLVIRAKNRDVDAFKILYTQYEYGISQSVNRLVRCTETTEDILQVAFTKAWYSLPDANSETLYKFPFWVRTIAINLAKNELKSRKHQGKHVAIQECVEDELYHFLNYAVSPEERVIQNECIEKASAQLTPEQRTCINFYYVRGMRQSEIAKALNMSEGQVEQHLGRGRKKFRAEYERINGSRNPYSKQ